jgi:hypothetical protein
MHCKPNASKCLCIGSVAQGIASVHVNEFIYTKISKNTVVILLS